MVSFFFLTSFAYAEETTRQVRRGALKGSYRPRDRYGRWVINEKRYFTFHYAAQKSFRDPRVGRSTRPRNVREDEAKGSAP